MYTVHSVYTPIRLSSSALSAPAKKGQPQLQNQKNSHTQHNNNNNNYPCFSTPMSFRTCNVGFYAYGNNRPLCMKVPLPPHGVDLHEYFRKMYNLPEIGQDEVLPDDAPMEISWDPNGCLCTKPEHIYPNDSYSVCWPGHQATYVFKRKKMSEPQAAPIKRKKPEPEPQAACTADCDSSTSSSVTVPCS